MEENTIHNFGVKDMPKEVLDGWLGEVCREHMDDLPIAYSWLSLVTAASALMGTARPIPVNLNFAPVGAIGSGKSQGIERSIALLGLREPVLLDVFAGSAEGLIKSEGIASANGEGRLFNVDELGHLLEKAKIDNSSFPFVINRAFYKNRFEVRLAKGQVANFNCWLSIVGGVVTERFEDLFGRNTTGGLYDRFLFGLCPAGYSFEFRNRQVPDVLSNHDGPMGICDRPSVVSIDPKVYDTVNGWKKDFSGRVIELCLRVAFICAAFDKRTILRAEDLGSAFALAKYQTDIRKLLHPNTGSNTDGILAGKFLRYLASVPPGEFAVEREMFNRTNAYDLGPGAARRVMDTLRANGDVEYGKDTNKRLVRLVGSEVLAACKP